MTSVFASAPQVLDEVVARHVRLVPDRDERREPNVQLPCVVENRETERAALRRHRHAARGRGGRRERGVQSHGRIRVDEPHAIRSDEPHAGASDCRDEALFEQLPGRARLGESGADHDEGLDAFGHAVFGDRVHQRGRHAHDRQIDRARHRAHARVGGNARDRLGRRVDGHDLAGEASGDDVVQDLGANLAALAIGANDRDARRREESLHRGRGRRFRSLGRAAREGGGWREREPDVEDAGVELALDLEAGIEQDAHHPVVVAEDVRIELLDAARTGGVGQGLEHARADAASQEAVGDGEGHFGPLGLGAFAVETGHGTQPVRLFTDQHEAVGVARAGQFGRGVRRR